MVIKNSRAKGNRTVRRAIEFYQQRGWLVDKVEKTSKFLKNKDLYSEYCDGFDLIGIRKNQTVLIQVKTNRPGKKDSYIDFAKKMAGTNLLVQMITWYDAKGFVLQKFYSTGRVVTEDLRT